MALDKKQIALTVGGIVAGLALTYLLYRLEQSNAASNAAAQANAEANAQSALANQQAQYASLPSISVPTISATPSTTASPTDTSNQSQASAIDPTLEAFLAAALTADNSTVTSAKSPVATITQLPFPTQNVIPAVVIPELQTFTGGATASPISAPFHSATRNGS